MIKGKTKRKRSIQQEQHKSEKGQCSTRQKTKNKKRQCDRRMEIGG